MQLDEPIEVKIYEWNTGGLLTRIEVIKKLISLNFYCLLLSIAVQFQCFKSGLRFPSTTFQGLRAFLLKFELMDRTTDLKQRNEQSNIYAWPSLLTKIIRSLLLILN
jgi:hypothetical protein